MLNPIFFRSPISKLPFTWRGSWRRTYLSLPPSKEVLIPTPNLFSDTLYRPFHMSQIMLDPYSSGIPSQNSILCFPSMTAGDFNTKYSTTPFILTSPVKHWPCYKDWTIASLVSKYTDIRFRAENVDWRLGDYYDYMQDQNDESPLYLFDRAFVEKTNGEMGRGFVAPECFGKDYFEVLGDERPDRRWMILGPKKSGSTFHKVGSFQITGSFFILTILPRIQMQPQLGMQLSKERNTGSCFLQAPLRQGCMNLKTIAK